jgi:tetratricopeptide (TPR) repeat protein
VESVNIKYMAYARALPPRPIRMAIGDWGGPAEKMADGSNPQPWHCLPFIEGSTYGLELLYPYETPCHVVGADGTIRFDWDYLKEPGGDLTGSEFKAFLPKQASKYYLFNTRLDLQPPPDYILRTEPHPRFFTDDTGTAPLAMIGHLQNEWYPRLLFVVFRGPRQGEKHIFRKGEPYAQILFIPKRMKYEVTMMNDAEAHQRRELEKAIEISKEDIADKMWHAADGSTLSNHYKVLANSFTNSGQTGVEATVREAVERRRLTIPTGQTIAENLALAEQFFSRLDYGRAKDVYTQILEKCPDCAEALSNLGVCYASIGNMTKGLDLMKKAVDLEPTVPKYLSNLGEMWRRMGQFQEAENTIRLVLRQRPNDPGTLSVLALILVEQDRIHEGWQSYQTATALGYPFPFTHYKMGLILFQKHFINEARACFETALAIDPEFHLARQALQKL